jgi:hypothetical protein
VKEPATVPPDRRLNPGCELTVTVIGLRVWQLLPTGIDRPPSFRLVIFMLNSDVTLTVFALRLAVPVAVPTGVIAVVADTGMKPNSLNEAVAGGSVSVDAVTAPVVRSTVLDRVPGPSGTVARSALR